MSIRQMIEEWVRDGDLCLLKPALPSTAAARFVFATAEIRDLVHGPWADIKDAKRFGEARATLDAFTSGQVLSVRVPPSRSVHAQIALLDSAEDEVWEIRVRVPKPGIRLFGRFAERDLFVATNWNYKENLLEDGGYHVAMEQCKRNWNRFFPSYQPLRGVNSDDYISNGFSL